MREIQVQEITDVVERLCIEANQYLPEDVQDAIRKCRACEEWEIAQGVLDKIIDNFEIAKNEDVPICQDKMCIRDSPMPARQPCSIFWKY